MGDEVTFELEGVPPNWSNGKGRNGWHVTWRAKKDWRERAYFRAQGYRVAAGWRTPDSSHPMRRRVQIVAYRARLLDRDGLYASLKPVVDGIKRALLVDDSERYCELEERQEKVPSYKDQKVRITVSEL